MTTIDSPPSSPKPTAPSGSVKGPFSPSTSVVTPPRENLSAPALSGKLRRNQSVGPCVNSAESGGDGNGAATHASSSVLNVSGNDLETSTISLGSSFRQRRRATSSWSIDLQAPLSDGDEATRPLFDLSASLYKRRGGMGWNADQNWCVFVKHM